MKRYFLFGLAAAVALASSAWADTNFAAASQKAAHCYNSPGGHEYSKKILPKVTAMAKDVMGYKSCFSLSKDSSCKVVIIISKTGIVQEVIPQPNNQIAACLAPQLKRYRFPALPNGSWYQVVTFNRKVEYVYH